MTRVRKRYPFRCPKCGAKPQHHGRGKCLSPGFTSACEGILCECADEGERGHGEYQDKPCTAANCYHCGWGGTLPKLLFDPAKLRGWAKRAYASGWRPPEGWQP